VEQLPIVRSIAHSSTVTFLRGNEVLLTPRFATRTRERTEWVGRLISVEDGVAELEWLRHVEALSIEASGGRGVRMPPREGAAYYHATRTRWREPADGLYPVGRWLWRPRSIRYRIEYKDGAAAYTSRDAVELRVPELHRGVMQAHFVHLHPDEHDAAAIEWAQGRLHEAGLDPDSMPRDTVQFLCAVDDVLRQQQLEQEEQQQRDSRKCKRADREPSIDAASDAESLGVDRRRVRAATALREHGRRKRRVDDGSDGAERVVAAREQRDDDGGGATAGASAATAASAAATAVDSPQDGERLRQMCVSLPMTELEQVTADQPSIIATDGSLRDG
jgi:hypothetical protein